MSEHPASLVISLDFELHWGVRDKKTIASYQRNLLGVRQVVPTLLRLFREYDIHATWATVGLLFFETREQLLRGLPTERPVYTHAPFSPYPALADIGEDEQHDPYHYAPSLIRMIAASPHQEIATHTFSHYYCLEDGQTADTFRADLLAAQAAARRYGVELHSIVFPRNQFNARYLAVCQELGIAIYRGNPAAWLYREHKEANESRVRRGLRLLDAYVNLSGHNSHIVQARAEDQPINVPASRFLRPYTSTLAALEPLRLRRIKNDLSHAARNEQMYHLWWHPHNFGADLAPNLIFLRKVLDHYQTLRTQYGMETLTMLEAASWKSQTCTISY